MNVRQNIISIRHNVASSPPLQADKRRRGGEPEIAPVLATESQNNTRLYKRPSRTCGRDPSPFDTRHLATLSDYSRLQDWGRGLASLAPDGLHSAAPDGAVSPRVDATPA